MLQARKYRRSDFNIAVQIIGTTMRERFHQSENSEPERLHGQEG